MGEKLVVFGEVFVNFLIDTTLDGKISQIILRQTNDGYEVNVMAESIINVCGLIHRKNFIMYGNVGNIVIKDTRKLIRLIKGMKGNVTLEIIKNKLLVSNDDREVEYGLASEEFVENNPIEKLPIKFDSGFIMDKTLLTEIKSKSDLLKVGKCVLDVKNNILRVTVEETDKFTVKQEVAYGNVTAEYGMWLLEISNFLEDKVNVSFQNDFPIQIMSKNDIMIIKYVISPIVKTSDDKTENATGEEKTESTT